VELAVELERSTSITLAVIFGAVMFFFIWRSFHSMRIGSEAKAGAAAAATPAE
jgi:K(+)-stimulated pyrophosphate-energized sodium pump